MRPRLVLPLAAPAWDRGHPARRVGGGNIDAGKMPAFAGVLRRTFTFTGPNAEGPTPNAEGRGRHPLV